LPADHDPKANGINVPDITHERHTNTAPDARLKAIAQLQEKARTLEWEVQRRITVERALAERDRELGDFLQNALEGLLKVGPDGTVFWVNGAGLELLGCSEAHCI